MNWPMIHTLQHPDRSEALCEYSIGAMQEALNEGIRLCILNLPRQPR
jgi:hypothetical protein